MHVPWQEFRPFHLAVFKGPDITVGNYFNSSLCFSLFFGLYIAVSMLCWNFITPYGRLESVFIVSR